MTIQGHEVCVGDRLIDKNDGCYFIIDKIKGGKVFGVWRDAEDDSPMPWCWEDDFIESLAQQTFFTYESANPLLKGLLSIL